MGRLVISLLVGVAGSVAIMALNQRQFSMGAPLVGLVAALLLGLILGLRRPKPGRALGVGLALGGLAGLVMAAGQVYGLTTGIDSLRLPAVLLDQMDDITLFWTLAGLSAGMCFLFAMGVTGALAGIVSSWTGLRGTGVPGRGARVAIAAAPAGRAPASRPVAAPAPSSRPAAPRPTAAPAPNSRPMAPRPALLEPALLEPAPPLPLAPLPSSPPIRSEWSGALLPGPLD